MTSENTQGKNQAVSLDDANLENVSGGGLMYTHVESTDKYYMWTSSCFTHNGKYLCPRCGRPVHYGAGCRFYCDPCDCSWWYENHLLPDTSSGNWREISKEEYNYAMGGGRCN